MVTNIKGASLSELNHQFLSKEILHNYVPFQQLSHQAQPRFFTIQIIPTVNYSPLIAVMIFHNFTSTHKNTTFTTTKLAVLSLNRSN